MDIKSCEKIEVTALDESVMIYLYEHEEDEKHVAAIGMDIELAKAVYEKLATEIPKAEKSWEYVKKILEEE